jgi:hypothetical protein
MPPIASSDVASPDDYQSLPMTCCGAFDIAEIEVVHTIDANDKSPRIVVSPASYNDYDDDDDDRNKNNNESSITATGPSSQFDYLRAPNSPDRSLADSFDSTDEILEGSNEMNLMRRVVEKQRANIIHRGKNRQGDQQNSGLFRQDSMCSDTNSVNSNDVFIINAEDSKEMEYLDVLDQHLNQTNPEAPDYAHLDDEIEDIHPNKYQASLDDIIEHLCAAPCGECALPANDIMNDGNNNTNGGYPKSVLRHPRYSSPSQYPTSSTTKEINNGENKPDEQQPILVRSSSDYNPTFCGNNNRQGSNNSVQFKNVDIRNFKMTLGNHPSATSGPPVMLDGELAEPRHLARKIIPLEKYERDRPPRRKRRQLKLTLQQRHNILVKERGFSFEEVKEAWQTSLHIRRQRRETLDRGLSMMKWDEVWESTCRKFNRLVDSTI